MDKSSLSYTHVQCISWHQHFDHLEPFKEERTVSSSSLKTLSRTFQRASNSWGWRMEKVDSNVNDQGLKKLSTEATSELFGPNWGTISWKSTNEHLMGPEVIWQIAKWPWIYFYDPVNMKVFPSELGQSRPVPLFFMFGLRNVRYLINTTTRGQIRAMYHTKRRPWDVRLSSCHLCNGQQSGSFSVPLPLWTVFHPIRMCFWSFCRLFLSFFLSYWLPWDISLPFGIFFLSLPSFVWHLHHRKWIHSVTLRVH